MINDMLARSPAEIELFNKMDREMFEREGREEKMNEIVKHKPHLTVDSPYNYRLTQEWEVPEWIKVKPVDEDKEIEDLMNLGKRQRKTITNIDNLSDGQFLKAIEEGEDLQAVMERVNKRREQRVAEGGPLYSEDDDEELDQVDNDDFEGPKSRTNAKSSVSNKHTSSLLAKRTNEQRTIPVPNTEPKPNESSLMVISEQKEGSDELI